MRRVIAQNIEHKKLKNLKLPHKKHYKIGYLLLSGLICLNLLLTSGCADKSAAMPAAQETTAEVSGETVQQPAEAAGETAEKLPAAEADQAELLAAAEGSGTLSNGSDCMEETEKTASFSSARREVPQEFVIEDFPIVLQMPELPTGCEVTALTMALQYYGFPADKTVMASRYLPTAAYDLYRGSDGRLYGPDLNRFFVGNPFSGAGYICGTEAIIQAANDYLSDQGSDLRAVDKTGSAPEELYRMVSEGTPVVVWVTISMARRNTPEGWYTESGDYVDWSTNDHGAVLVGYTPESVVIADPIAGRVTYSREAFESVFASRGNQCVVIQ